MNERIKQIIELLWLSSMKQKWGCPMWCVRMRVHVCVSASVTRRRSYIKRGSKWEEEGGHKESSEEGSGGNGRGSVVGP